MSLGKKIKKLRIQQGITQVQLALKANIPQSVISDIENDKRKHGVSSGYLKNLAHVLSVSVSELLDDEEQSA